MRSALASRRFSAASFSSSSGSRRACGDLLLLEAPKIQQPQPVLLVTLQVSNALLHLPPAVVGFGGLLRVDAGECIQQCQARSIIEGQHRFVLCVDHCQVGSKLL